jgi:hypothetical protein
LAATKNAAAKAARLQNPHNGCLEISFIFIDYSFLGANNRILQALTQCNFTSDRVC